MRTLFALAALLLAAPLVLAGGPIATGPWRAWLDSPGGELPFGLEIEEAPEGLSITITNADERIEIPGVALDDDTLTISFEHYDAAITARLSEDGTRLDGRWTKTGRDGAESGLDFHARAGQATRFRLPQTRHPSDAPIDGRWSVRFASSHLPAVAEFDLATTGVVTGTFLTTTGDYRFLEGDFNGRTLRLSCFDGAHAFLFRAHVQPDATLAGDFWSRDSWHETWTARPAPGFTLPDAFLMTSIVDRTPDLDRLVFTDLEGRSVSLADLKNPERPMIVEVFGSWCPNCHDAARHLDEIAREYDTTGLVVVGLAFELTDDVDRSIKQVEAFRARHDITYPMLIAGKADKETAVSRIPVIDRVRSYPTAIFIDAAGRVRATYTGYAGPATGEAHTKLKSDFDAVVRELLDEVIK